MKFIHFHWLIMLIVAVIHLHHLLIAFQLPIPFYITFLLAIGSVLLLQKVIPDRVDKLDGKANSGIYIIQILLPALYLWMEPNLGYLIPFVIFIILEGVRHLLSLTWYRSKQWMDNQRKEIKQLNETFLIVRKERHDFLKHISALHYMLENNNPKEASDYLNSLVEGYKETNLSIQGENGTVAGMLHQSYQKGKEKQIEIIYDLESAISSLPLSDYDLTVLIGNILENALDASDTYQQATGEKAHITLQAYKRSGLFILNCKNDTLPLPNDVLDHLFTKQVKTTKSGKHEGLGTQIITEVVKKYQGHLDFTYKNKTFMLHIKLPAIKF